MFSGNKGAPSRTPLFRERARTPMEAPYHAQRQSRRSALWQSTGNNIWKAVPTIAAYKRQCRIGNIVLRQERYDTQDGRIQAVVCRRAACAGRLFLQPVFVYGRSTDDLFLLRKNPAEFYSFIEAAPKINSVSVKKPEWYVLDGLAFGYTAAHGVGGAGHSHARIRNCDFFWIGGGHLYTRNDRPTRYGNGVEFWCTATDCVSRLSFLADLRHRHDQPKQRGSVA